MNVPVDSKVHFIESMTQYARMRIKDARYRASDQTASKNTMSIWPNCKTRHYKGKYNDKYSIGTFLIPPLQ